MRLAYYYTIIYVRNFLKPYFHYGIIYTRRHVCNCQRRRNALQRARLGYVCDFFPDKYSHLATTVHYLSPTCFNWRPFCSVTFYKMVSHTFSGLCFQPDKHYCDSHHRCSQHRHNCSWHETEHWFESVCSYQV